MSGVFRIFDLSGLKDHLDHMRQDEEDVVWLKDPSEYPYLRQTEVMSRWRRRRPQFTQGQLVAYATLKPTAEGYDGYFDRRVWYFAHHDPYKLGAPSEAVIPSSIRAGARGEQPTHLWEQERKVWEQAECDDQSE